MAKGRDTETQDQKNSQKRGHSKVRQLRFGDEERNEKPRNSEPSM